MNEIFVVPDDLHPETVNLVSRFATALAEKLAIAQRKYGWDRHWQSPAWMDQCREQLVEHVAKGDPRDVAAYCAFLWHHGESTAMPAVEWTKDAEEYGSALNEAAWTFVGECPEKSALLFNNTKASLRAAILTYAQHVARATPPAHTSEARDAARYRWLRAEAQVARVRALADELEVLRDAYRAKAEDANWAPWVRDDNKSRASELTGVIRGLRAALEGSNRGD